MRPAAIRHAGRGAGGLVTSSVLTGFLCIVHIFQAARAFGGDDLYNFYAEEATVVAAAKHPQLVSDAPASTQVVTRAQIEAHGYRTLGEILQSVPGLFVTDDRNYSYLWVRGFGRPGDFNSRVLLLVNGHRVNDNIYGGALIGREFSLDVHAIERVEVVKGPGSALYGDSAFFAVINVITKSARESPGLEVRGSTASFGSREAAAGFATPLTHGVSGVASGSYRNMSGQDLFYPEFASIARGADAEKNHTFYAGLTRGGWLLHGNTSGRTKTIPTAAYGTRFGDSGTYTTDKRSFIELRGECQLRGGVQVFGRAYRDRYRYYADYVYDAPDSAGSRLINRDFSAADWYGEELRVDRELFGRGNRLMLGQEIEKNVRGVQKNFDVEPYELYLDDNRKPDRYAFFAQQELRPHARLDLTLGLRYDRYDSFGGTLNPRTAANCRLPDGSRLKLLYGSAFRAPTPYELPVDESAPKLRPERVRTWEACWEKRHPNWGTVGVSLFRNRIENLISQVRIAADEVAYVNDASVLSRGIELGSTWDWGRISGHCGYLYQNSSADAGRTLSNSPHHIGSLGLARRLPWLGARLGIETFIVSQRATLQRSTLPRAGVGSLHLSMRPPRTGLELQASIHNVTDADYRVSGSGEHVQDSIRQDGRSFGLSLAYRFENKIGSRP